jgi:NtrC-family two-component system response regulator AlgB
MVDKDQTQLKLAKAEVTKAGHTLIPAVSLKQLHEHMSGEAKIQAIFISQRFGKKEDLSHLDAVKIAYPDIPIVVCAEHTNVEAAVISMKKDAHDYIQKPFAPGVLLKVLQDLEEISVSGTKRKAGPARPGKKSSPRGPALAELIFHSKNRKTQRAFDIAFRAAQTDASILLLGPSGTGKSVLAREIHSRSLRSDKPFVTVSCPSLSEHLLESELFGHMKGAFTGAVNDSWGKVHAAETGTLFLDEIGDMPMKIQPRLLRLLQEMEYERLGETTVREANIRVISATNSKIAAKIGEGKFREDLLYRLNVISVHMPPLEKRSEDLPDLIDYFLEFYSQHHGRGEMTFSDEAHSDLLHYPWPGNLREMNNVIERCVILAESSPIPQESLPPEIIGTTPVPLGPGQTVTLAELSDLHIQKVLDQADSLEAAAHTLGIDTATLYRKRKKMGLLDEEHPETVTN